jgi:hypothetical protein
MTETPTMTTEAENNGSQPLVELPQIIATLRWAIQARQEQADVLRMQLDELNKEIRRYERALAPLVNEPSSLTKSRAKPGPKPSPRTRGIGDERLAQIERTILDYARDHEEFRQVEIRSLMPSLGSGAMAIAFEQLRQDGVIRFARKDGNSKVFRLTNQAVTEVSDGRN